MNNVDEKKFIFYIFNTPLYNSASEKNILTTSQTLINNLNRENLLI